MKVPRQTKLLLVAGAAIWLILVAGGLTFLFRYQTTPGESASAPKVWPRDALIPTRKDSPVLVMFVHPRCPCSRASIGELAAVMTHAEAPVQAWVCFLKPAGFSDGWEKTDLWANAQRIPGVKVLRDENGTEAQRFHVSTSGQTLFYGVNGGLLFNGGITGGRGHFGENPARNTLVQLMAGSRKAFAQTAVYGCSLRDEGGNSDCLNVCSQK